MTRNCYTVTMQRKTMLSGDTWSIDTACEFVKANVSDQLHNVIMCHLSKENADAGKFIEKMKKTVPNVNVCVAEPGMKLELRNPGECPF